MKIILLFAVFIVGGCASAINERNAHNYANAAASAVQAGNWESARRNWAKAVTNAQLGGMSGQQLSIAYYEYGRAAGATCHFEESENYLSKSLTFDQTNNGPTHMPLLELARLKLAQRQYGEAINYFELLIPIYELHKAAEEDPAGVAEVYKELSDSLAQVGREREAKKYQGLSKALKETSTEKQSSSEITPYGQHCSQS